MELMMPSFHNGAVEIAYLDEGEGDPIVLVHGFASSKNVNWVYPTWVSDLKKDGRRVIALDNRGHGKSSKPHDPGAYGLPIMGADVLALLDHVEVERADYLGYSMGGRIGMLLALTHPVRIRSAILGGIGASLITGPGRGDHIVAALEAPSAAAVSDPIARSFRVFADGTKSDLAALAACMKSLSHKFLPEELAKCRVPVLIVRGGDDDIAGPARELPGMIPGAEYVEIPGRNHMSAVGDKVFKEATLDFLRRRP
jgi:pimeloyl-ACP methyl ester carboxylesterase